MSASRGADDREAFITPGAWVLFPAAWFEYLDNTALPLYVSALGRSEFLGPVVRRLPMNTGVMLLALAAFAFSVGLITIGAQAIAALHAR